jgi:hypothetical protein
MNTKECLRSSYTRNSVFVYQMALNTKFLLVSEVISESAHGDANMTFTSRIQLCYEIKV